MPVHEVINGLKSGFKMLERLAWYRTQVCLSFSGLVMTALSCGGRVLVQGRWLNELPHKVTHTHPGSHVPDHTHQKSALLTHSNRTVLSSHNHHPPAAPDLAKGRTQTHPVLKLAPGLLLKRHDFLDRPRKSLPPSTLGPHRSIRMKIPSTHSPELSPSTQSLLALYCHLSELHLEPRGIYCKCHHDPATCRRPFGVNGA